MIAFAMSGAGLCCGAVAPSFDEGAGMTLFAFDRASIPFTENLRLEMRTPERHPSNPVVSRGGPGSPDSWAVQFYGSVIREGAKFRMWYVAAGDDRVEAGVPDSVPWRPAYAESVDGVRWTKPSLGLVEYRGNRENNLVLTDPAPLGILNLKVIREPDDPDPGRRYKMAAHVWFRRGTRRHGTLAPLISADGLRWRLVRPARVRDGELLADDLFLPPIHYEPAGGLYRWGATYHVVGQNANVASRPYHGRVVRVYPSPDFVDWSHASAVGFVRGAQHRLLGPGRSREGEQTHEGIGVWNRGNILLGLYGRWHGGKTWGEVGIDLGFVISDDGVHFHEPAHEWTFLERGGDGEWDRGGLLQGQGFENVGERTHIYYGAWDPRRWEENPPRGGVGLATLPRDRFGDLVVEEAGRGEGEYQLPEIRSGLLTAPLPLGAGGDRRFTLNATGLGAEAALRVELLDEAGRSLAGYSGARAALVRRGGYHEPIVWGNDEIARDLPGCIRVRLTWEGARRREIRFSALYVQPACSGVSGRVP